jgi:hypothetical protein
MFAVLDTLAVAFVSWLALSMVLELLLWVLLTDV